MRPRRPRGFPVLTHARHGAWVLEVHYPGSALRDVFGMFVDETKARDALAFLELVAADDQLSDLDRDGDDLVVDYYTAGWFGESR